MHPKIKNRAAGTESGTVKPLLLHDVAHPAASANAASRQRVIPARAARDAANHARHHISRQTQS
jgi:hypothetical protein